MSELPTSFSEGLQVAASFLDLGDRLAFDVARSVGSDYVPGSAVQDDLRSMALWLDAHPDALVSQANDYFLSLLGTDKVDTKYELVVPVEAVVTLVADVIEPWTGTIQWEADDSRTMAEEVLKALVEAGYEITLPEVPS